MSSPAKSLCDLQDDVEVADSLLSSEVGVHVARHRRRDLKLPIAASVLFGTALVAAALARAGDLMPKEPGAALAAAPAAVPASAMITLDDVSEDDGGLFEARGTEAKGEAQTYTVPETGKYMLVVAGAGGNWGGRGVTLTGVVSLEAESVLSIQVGQLASPQGCGGGGATAVKLDESDKPLMVAGGGGGQDGLYGASGGDAVDSKEETIKGSGGTEGHGGRSFVGEGGQGGAGWYEGPKFDGHGDPHGPTPLMNGGFGGAVRIDTPAKTRNGGYGGGGANWYGCAGGGGFSGGAGAPPYGKSGGGGSFSAEDVVIVDRAKSNRGGGFVKITKVSGNFTPKPMPSTQEEMLINKPSMPPPETESGGSSASPATATETAVEAKPTHVSKGHCTPDARDLKNKRVKASPSLFCWSIMVAGSDEQALVKEQLGKKTSIFGCNDYAVISRGVVYLGQDECGADINTWVNDMPASLPRGQNGGDPKVLNSQVFVNAWKTLFASGAPFNQDFTMKADPDAIFLPDRARLHVSNYTGQSAYFLNCRRWEGDQDGKLAGSLEVFTQGAMQSFKKGIDSCQSLPYQQMGEDEFIQKCMVTLGVKAIPDFAMVSDQSCSVGSVSCEDGWRASFHPYKTSAAYWGCFDKATAR